MARITVNPTFVEGKLLLDVISQIQRTRAQLKRVNDIMDFTRIPPSDYSPLATALGCSAAEAAIVYSRMKSIQSAMDAIDFVNLSELDQG